MNQIKSSLNSIKKSQQQIRNYIEKDKLENFKIRTEDTNWVRTRCNKGIDNMTPIKIVQNHIRPNSINTCYYIIPTLFTMIVGYLAAPTSASTIEHLCSDKLYYNSYNFLYFFLTILVTIPSSIQFASTVINHGGDLKVTVDSSVDDHLERSR